ncbi:MAG: hypothetical protein LBP95_02095 [Deltaproteobacteria bacterium]|nr:hypothetical protein [Deltaproteobacteria bacterium]
MRNMATRTLFYLFLISVSFAVAAACPGFGVAARAQDAGAPGFVPADAAPEAPAPGAARFVDEDVSAEEAGGEGADGTLAGGSDSHPAAPPAMASAPPAPARPLPTVPELAPAGGPPTFILVAPETGHWSVFGSEAVLGAELAIKNMGGNFALKTVDESDPALAGYLQALGSPLVVFGHLFETTLAQAAPYYKKIGAPVILTYIESPQTADLGPGYVRLLPDPASQGRRLAREVPRSGKRVRQVFILEGPDQPQKELAEAFRQHLVNPAAPEPTKADPKPQKPRAMKPSQVTTVAIENADDLLAVNDFKSTPQDWILVALPPRLAMRAAPILGGSSMKRATFLLPMSLSVREIGAAFLAADIRNAQMALPLEFGSGKTANKNLSEFRRRYLQFHRREPSWAAVVAYDAATLAQLAVSNEGGAMSYLSDGEMAHVTAAGRPTLGSDGWPVSMVKMNADQLHWLP